ncbi:MAG: amidase [Pseudonocardiaceae bacterium]|nr:amidase [Pseudonocardiaceae bacterium]
MPTGQTAEEIARAVRAGDADPADVVESALRRIERAGEGAFRRVRIAEARAEAKALRDHPERAELPLAGVPVAVKDHIAVQGETSEVGSLATSREPALADHDVVRRLRAAGAIVVGLTRVPELCIWPTSDTPDGIARNPWNPERVAGGSSGGSAAAVAGGLVPIAHGTDGMGSIRIPAATCGVVGMKPGTGVVAEAGEAGWFGMSAHGSLATTVTDAALMLSVLAERPDLARPVPPSGPLRIALSCRVPLTRAPIPGALRSATREVAEVLRAQGHRVEVAHPDYGVAAMAAMTARWFAGPAEQAAGLDQRLLQPRTRGHIRVGRALSRAGLIRDDVQRRWADTARSFLADFDVLLTPTVASQPPKAQAWHRRGWLANVAVSARFGPFCGPWNFAGLPAISVPTGRTWRGVPVAVQLAAGVGGEARLLGLAAQLEEVNPWLRLPADAG